MSSRVSRRRWLVLSFALVGAAGSVVIACGGDDTSTSGNTDDASTQDAGLNIDSSIITNVDSGAHKDSGADAGDASDAAVLCLAAPDAAIYGSDAIDAGSMIVAAHACTGCHTGNLSGNASTPVSGQYPRNITPDLATGIGCWSDEQIAQAVLFGIDNQGVALCVMPKFEATIGDGGVSDLIAYLRSVPAVSNDVPDGLCPSDAGADADAH
ncbi:MAG: cytochrome c [Polyangiaceae bacterium]